MLTDQEPINPDAVTFGVRVPNSGPFAETAHIVSTAKAAERLGYETLWVHDHIPWASEMLTHFSTGSIEACADQDPNFFETTSTVAYLAGLCPGLDVGIAGLVLPLRDPRVLAKQLMTTQVLTGGRLVTALAIGNIPNDFDVMQVPFNRRGRITDEFLEALDRIYAGPTSSFEGERLAFAEAQFYPKPASRRFWIAGNSPPAYRRIARHATGWLPGGISPESYSQGLEEVAGAMELHGRHVATLQRGVELFLCLGPTMEQARATAARSLEHRFGSVDSGVERNLVGGPADIAEKVDAFRRAGVTHFELRAVCQSPQAQIEMLEQFQREVVPEVGAPAPL